MNLKDQTVIITGASSGLGKGIASVFAKSNANIVMAARNPEKLNTAQEVLKKVGANILAVPTDVGNADQVEDLIHKAVDTFGSVDVLINNAGIDFPGPITELTTKQWDQIISVNLSGVFYACKAVFPIMIKQATSKKLCVKLITGWSKTTETAPANSASSTVKSVA